VRRSLFTRIGSLVAVAALAGLGLAATSTAAAAAKPQPVAAFAGVFNPIKNVGTGLCLQPQGGGGGEVVIVQERCVPNSLTQNWQWRQVNGSVYQMINQLSGLCVYMNGPVAARSPLIQAGCTTVSNEKWKPSGTPPDVVSIQSYAGNRNTNLCVEAENASTAAGARTWIQTCNGSLAQRWIVGFP
jgi:hypothetical protein